MSTTIKQAIEALKSRIAGAYTAIVAKGGTLPATQDSANLPSAIASIPSGGSPFDALTQLGFTPLQIQELDGMETPSAEDIAAAAQYMNRSGEIGRCWQGNQYRALRYLPSFHVTSALSNLGRPFYDTLCVEICAGFTFDNDNIRVRGGSFAESNSCLSYIGGDTLRFTFGMYYAFNGCVNLKRLPKISLPISWNSDQSKGSMQSAFSSCRSLVKVEFVGEDIKFNKFCLNTFNGCIRIKRILGEVDWSAVTNTQDTFTGCISLEEIWIKNLRIDLNISQSGKIKYECLLYMVQNLQSNGSKRLTLGTANRNRLSATEEGQNAIAAAQEIGWTIA